MHVKQFEMHYTMVKIFFLTNVLPIQFKIKKSIITHTIRPGQSVVVSYQTKCSIALVG